MITAVFETLNDEARLAYALAALVPAAMEGIVSAVLVVDRGSRDGTLTVADAAGCVVVRGGALADAVLGARGEWLLFLSPAAEMAAGWERAALAFADAAMVAGAARSRVGVFRSGRLIGGWRASFAGWHARGGLRAGVTPTGGEGWLVARQAYVAMMAGREAVSASAAPAGATSSASGARRGAA